LSLSSQKTPLRQSEKSKKNKRGENKDSSRERTQEKKVDVKRERKETKSAGIVERTEMKNVCFPLFQTDQAKERESRYLERHLVGQEQVWRRGGETPELYREHRGKSGRKYQVR